ncbi:MAG: hypothetical protein KBE65_16755 [Phycisphaerae bacterium]|nr:hypothetical protein [Phycisphaerae bacterium]
MMTREEIDQCWEETQSLAGEILRTSANQGSGIRGKVEKLAVKVGACTRIIENGSLNPDNLPALVQGIHQALQTASMIDACRTAAENVKLAENAQAAASRAQQIAFWSMLAAWGAVVVNIVVA